MIKYYYKIGGLSLSKGYSIRVRIGGRSLSIISDAKPEYMTQIASKVDKTITGLLNANSALTFEKAAILTALKFCDEATNNEKQNTNFNDDNNMTEENAKLTKESVKDINEEKIESEADNLRKQVVEYSKELSKLEKENKSLIKELEMLKNKKR